MPEHLDAPSFDQPLPMRSPSLPAPPAATLLIVDAQGKGDYTSIGAAINESTSGSVIMIRPGCYPETLSIDWPLTIMGETAHVDLIEIYGSIISNSDHVILQNLKIYITDLEPTFDPELSGRSEIDDIRRLAAGHQDKLVAAHHQITHRTNDLHHLTHQSQPQPSFDRLDPGPGTLLDNESAAIIVLQGTLTLTDCLIQGGRGSAIHVCNVRTRLIARNCTIQNSDAGLYQGPHTQVDLDHCEIRDTERVGIFADRSSILTLHQCQIHSSVGNGAVLDGCNRVLIDQCKIFNNRESGLLLKEVLDFHIQHSEIYDHPKNGICIRRRSRGIIKDCQVFGNGWPNIAVIGGANAEILQSHIFEGLTEGIKIAEGSRVKVVGSTIEQHNQKAIHVGQGCNISLHECQVKHNTDAGLWIERSGHGIVEKSRFQANGHERTQAAIESEGDLVVRRCWIQGNYIGIRSRNASSVIVKLSTVTANSQGAFVLDNDGTIGKFFNYEGFMPMLQIKHPLWKLAGAAFGVGIGLYGMHRLVEYTQHAVLKTQAQVQSLQAEQSKMSTELAAKDQTNQALQQDQERLKQDQEHQLAIKQQQIQSLSAKAEADKLELTQQNQALETKQQSLTSQLEQAKARYTPPAESSSSRIGGTWERQAFKDAVMGKLPEQVRNIVGKPDRVSDNAGSEWEYSHKIIDPTTRRPDLSAHVMFIGSTVGEVRFSGG
jgi:Right handed beta helix region